MGRGLHATHCETFYFVSGEVEWTVGGESHRLKAGDAVYIPPNTVHKELLFQLGQQLFFF